MSAKNYDNLPDQIPIFPLTGVLLLPRGHLPLNIFEPRYLSMVDDAMRGDRLIGMIQPKEYQADEIYDIGCAGRIISYEETPDGRYLITLEGVSRFRVKEEIRSDKDYRSVMADWSEFSHDSTPMECLDLNKKALIDLLGDYFDKEGLSCDWGAVENSEDEKLITALSMICPFDAKEKQVLLEAPCCKARAETFMTMLDFAVKSLQAAENSISKH